MAYPSGRVVSYLDVATMILSLRNETDNDRYLSFYVADSGYIKANILHIDDYWVYFNVQIALLQDFAVMTGVSRRTS